VVFLCANLYGGMEKMIGVCELLWDKPKFIGVIGGIHVHIR
jgi:hypothetical protein